MSKDALVPSCPRYLLFEIRLPPDMIGVDSDPNAIPELLADVKRLPERVHTGTVSGIHRMQRLDRDWHSGCPRMRHERGEPLHHHKARSGKVARAQRQTAHHHYPALGPDRHRLVDRALVVVDRRRPAARIAGRKHPTPAIPGNAHAVILDPLR